MNVRWAKMLAQLDTRIRYALIVLMPLLVFVVACGRPEIEEVQRTWLEEQHTLEKQVLEAWHAHDSLRRSAPADRSRKTVNADSEKRFDYVDSVLTTRRRAIDAIESLIDRHSLARDNAIRSDSAGAVANGFASAKIDYAQSARVLDTITQQLAELARTARGIDYADTSRALPEDVSRVLPDARR